MKNRKFWVSVLAGIMAGVMVLGLILSILPARVFAEKSSAEIQEELDALEEEQNQLGSQMEQLQGQQNENWESVKEMVAYKNNIDQQIHVLSTEILNLEKQIRSYSLLIAEKQTQLDEAQKNLDELNRKNRERIRSMEENGKISYWSVIFKASSFTDLVDRIHMIEEIQQADRRRIEELNQAAVTVASAREALSSEKTALEGSRVAQQEARKALDEKRAEADGLLAELNARQLDLVDMMAEIETMRDALNADIAATEQAFTEAFQLEEEERRRQEELENQQNQQNQEQSGGSAPAPSPGGWVTPCSYILMTSPYGWREHPITGEATSFHNGVDLANNEGTPIYASRDGVVTTATYSGIYGYYVTVNHGDGYSTLYAHMCDYVVSEGEYVSAGQIIGYMGSTGWSTGPHLHFSIYYDGNTVDPMEYI